MALLQSMKVFLLLSLLAPQYEAFLKRNPKQMPRIRIHLEEDEHIVVPKYSRIKYLDNVPIFGITGEHPSPVGVTAAVTAGHIPTSDAFIFHPSLPKITSGLHKKRPQIKYLKHTTAYGKLTAGGSGGDGLLQPVSIVVPAHQLFGTVHQSHHHPVLQHLSHPHSHPNVKPVTEHIEDDLKYDFRTKTHTL